MPIHQRAAVLKQEAQPIHVGIALLYLSASRIPPDTTRVATSLNIISDIRVHGSDMGVIRIGKSHRVEQKKNTLNQRRVKDGQTVRQSTKRSGVYYKCEHDKKLVLSSHWWMEGGRLRQFREQADCQRVLL